MQAYCPNCNRLYESAAFGGDEGTTIKFENIGIGGGFGCPQCHRSGVVLDGTYRLDRNGVARLLTGPQFTIDILNDLKSIAETAIKEDYTSEQFINKAKSSNKFFDFLRYCIPQDKKELRNFLAGLLVLLIPIIYDKCKATNEKSVNTYIDNSTTEIKIITPPSVNKNSYIPKQVPKNNKQLRIIKKREKK